MGQSKLTELVFVYTRKGIHIDNKNNFKNIVDTFFWEKNENFILLLLKFTFN